MPGDGSPPLFGRERELGELHAALLSAEGGKGALVLLVGEPGIGKTRLANDFADKAHARGTAVTWGRAWEAGGAPAYWPWVEVLRPFAAAFAATSDAARARIAPLARLLPELEECEPPKPAADPAQDRFRLFEAALALLTLAARDQPLVVILDDMHVADVGSLALLHFVARNLHAARVVVVATYRDVEARLSPEAGDALSKVAREGRYLALRRLGRDEVAGWAAAEGHADADALYSITEGNPLFVVEMLRLTRDSASTAATRLPDSVRDVLRARLSLLSPPARSLLDVGSVLGRTIDLGLVALLIEEPLPTVRALAAEAAERDLLVDAGDRSSFSHILFREVLYQDLAETRRVELHARVARALLERHGDDADAPLAEAVHHLFAAAPLVPPDEAITWARRGARWAIRRLAFEQGVELLSRALDHLPPGCDADKCDLLLDLAKAQIGAGQVARGRETALAAASIARHMDDGQRLARAALRYGGAYVIAFVDRRLVSLLEEGLAALPTEDSPLRAELLARLGAALQPALDPEHPNTLAREAIAMARRVQTDDVTLLSVLVAGTSALSYFGDPSERLPLDTELITLATRHGDRISVLRALMRLAFDHLELGDDASADHAIDEYDTVSSAIDLPAFRWRALAMRSMRAIMLGRYDESEALSAEAAQIAARGEDAVAPVTLSLQRAGLLLASGQLSELSAQLPVALALLTRFADPIFKRTFRAGMLTQLGRAEEAREDLEFLVRHDPPLRGRPMLVWAADACLALGDRRAAATLAGLLGPLKNRRYFWSPGAIVMEKRTIASVVDALCELATESVHPVSPPVRMETFELVKEAETWTIRADTTFRLRDSRGLAILATLVQHPRREFHATDLVAPAGAALLEDAGEVLDARAVAAYRERLQDLRDTEAEAIRNNDTHRAAHAREEIEALTGELAQGVGLGGRSRRASSTAEKARINARKRITDAIRRIREHSPALAKHLERSVKTGMFCSYDP